MIAGVLNIIYGIGAIDDANFYTATGTHYVFGSLHTWGWVTLILGIVQLTAGFSLFAGGTYGRVIGIVAGRSVRSGRCSRSGAFPSGRWASSRSVCGWSTGWSYTASRSRSNRGRGSLDFARLPHSALDQWATSSSTR